MTDFLVESPFQPSGDQPTAIQKLAEGLNSGLRYQTLEGITGSGKTATIAWLIERVQRPALILEPNKSLAAQLASELREMLPNNRVEFFVSYYDYYQPEAYIPSSDTYIEKDSSINEENCNGIGHPLFEARLGFRDKFCSNLKSYRFCSETRLSVVLQVICISQNFDLHHIV